MNTALDLVVCALDGCYKISAPDEVVWNHLTDLGYCSIEHMAKGIPFTCAYCGGPRDRARDWHDCPQSVAAQKRLQVAVSGIQADMLKPGQRRLTSDAMKQRADRRRETANGLLVMNKHRPKRNRVKVVYDYRPLNSGSVGPEYENGND